MCKIFMRSYIIIVLILINTYLAFSIVISKFINNNIGKLERDLQKSQHQLTILQSDNKNLEWQINSLSDGHVNKEFLDMTLKKYISYSDKNEKLIITTDEI